MDDLLSTPGSSLTASGGEGDVLSPSVASGDGGPAAPGPPFPPKRCTATTKAGSPCSAWPVAKPGVPNPKGLCAGHLGLGLAKAPGSYGRLGAIAKNAQKPSLRGAGASDELLEKLREAVEESGDWDDPILKAQAEQLLSRRTASALTIERATKVVESKAEKARAAAAEQLAFETKFVERNFGGTGPEAWEAFERWKLEKEKQRSKAAAAREVREELEARSAKRWIDPETLPPRKRRRRSSYLPPHIQYSGTAEEVAAYEREAARGRGQFTTPVTLW